MVEKRWRTTGMTCDEAVALWYVPLLLETSEVEKREKNVVFFPPLFLVFITTVAQWI